MRDGCELWDALRNLIENAVAHSPPGGEVRVSVAAPGSIRVADQGRGIPENLREPVFERFWRGRGEQRTDAGLGPSIVHDIMRGYGGTVETAGNPGGGVDFTFNLSEPASIGNNNGGQDK